MLSSTCQHVATLQFFSGAETNSEPFPDLILVFYVEGEIAGLPWKAFPPKQAYVYSLDISVFLWLRKQRPKIPARPAQGYFRMKDVDRRTEAIAQVNVESKEEKVERAGFNVPTCGHIAVCQRCRDKQIQSLFPTSSLFSTLKVRLRVCPGKPARQNRHMYTP